MCYFENVLLYSYPHLTNIISDMDKLVYQKAYSSVSNNISCLDLSEKIIKIIAKGFVFPSASISFSTNNSSELNSVFLLVFFLMFKMANTESKIIEINNMPIRYIILSPKVISKSNKADPTR